MDTHTETLPPPNLEQHAVQGRRWTGPVLLLGLVAGLGGLLVGGLLPRHARVQALEAAVAGQQRTYAVERAALADPQAELVLPSSVEAAQDTPIYPRVNGYVKRIGFDIGAQVQAGEVLAEIETPELDQQVSQARAALEQARANLDLAQVSYGRWSELQKSRVVAPQEVDERRSALEARKADVAAADANLERLVKTQSYQKITAPFAGTVTKRLVEVGQLVTGDLNDTTRILFQVQQTSTLRAFVSVPQSAYRDVRVGQPVEVTFREVPGKVYPGKVVRTAGALDGGSRTLRTEIHVANEGGELLPGAYAEVRFAVHRAQPPVVIPARALILQTAGPQIAILNEENRVSVRPVTITRDLGKTLELAAGLPVGTRYIANPNDTLQDGQVVKVESEPVHVAAR